MNIVIDSNGEINRIISNSASPQDLREGEFELTVNDPEIIEAFHKGQEIIYDPVSEKVQAIPQMNQDPEKVALYEAIAGLFEEVQILKKQMGGDA